jgi:hypothetical protein
MLIAIAASRIAILTGFARCIIQSCPDPEPLIGIEIKYLALLDKPG